MNVNRYLKKKKKYSIHLHTREKAICSLEYSKEQNLVYLSGPRGSVVGISFFIICPLSDGKMIKWDEKGQDEVKS